MADSAPARIELALKLLGFVFDQHSKNPAAEKLFFNLLPRVKQVGVGNVLVMLFPFVPPSLSWAETDCYLRG